MNQIYYEEIIKIILIGDSNVGKTSIMNRFCHNKYNPIESTTIGIEYGNRIVKVHNKSIYFQIWDTSGQQKFNSITPSYFRSAMAILLVFSANDKDSFNSIVVWMKRIALFAQQGRYQQIQVNVDQIRYKQLDTPILILCNKADLTKKQVSQKQCQSLSQVLKIEVIPVSAKQNINIDESILKLYNKINKPNYTFKINKNNTSKCQC